MAEQVEVLGYPLGESLSAISGSVSGLDRTVLIDGVRRRGLVQTDAAINFGNSGGPMMRVDNGKVMGLIDAVHAGDAHGISWAVSAQVAAPLLRDWNSTPQQVELASCDAQLAEAAYARRIASILELSAAGRGNVGRIVARVKVGTTVLSEGARQMKDPIANRQAVLRQITTLPTAPAGAVAVAPALVAAIQTSLDADNALRTWMTNLPSDPAFKADHQQWKNTDFQLAAEAFRRCDPRQGRIRGPLQPARTAGRARDLVGRPVLTPRSLTPRGLTRNVRTRRGLARNVRA